MSTKTKDQLLLDYRKSNKARRTKIVLKAGFADEAGYLIWLMGPDAVPEEKPIIHNVHIVDISWSMHGSKLAAAVQGVNSEIAELKKDDTVEYLQTIVNFSGPYQITTVVDKVPIADVRSYRADAINSTALNQAVGETLVKVRINKKAGEKVLVKIFTDGEENASTGEFRTPAALKKLIQECEENDFTVTFVGTDRDVRHVINTLSIDESNTLAHLNTADSIGAMFRATTSATMLYAKNVKEKKSVKRGFYKSLKTN